MKYYSFLVLIHEKQFLSAEIVGKWGSNAYTIVGSSQTEEGNRWKERNYMKAKHNYGWSGKRIGRKSEVAEEK